MLEGESPVACLRRLDELGILSHIDADLRLSPGQLELLDARGRGACGTRRDARRCPGPGLAGLSCRAVLWFRGAHHAENRRPVGAVAPD